MYLLAITFVCNMALDISRCILDDDIFDGKPWNDRKNLLT